MLLAMAFLSSCGTPAELDTVDEVDLERYMGTWYEIGRLPNSFENGLECVTANYSLKDNGKIQVINRGYKDDDITAMKESKGTAWVPNPEEPGRLKVRFFWPFAGDYYIMKLDPEYEYVVVGSPTRKYLWFLSRHKRLDGNTINELLQFASDRGFDVEQIKWVDQSCG